MNTVVPEDLLISLPVETEKFGQYFRDLNFSGIADGKK
jgi:hypothetical protein